MDIREGTATIVPVGPLVDVGDGFTLETGVTLAGSARLNKHNVTTSVDISGRTWTGVTSMSGMYGLSLTAADTDTEGRLVVLIEQAAVHLPRIEYFNVLSQQAYDAKHGADVLQVDVTQWLGQAVTASANVPDVNVQAIDANAITAASIAANALTAAKIATDAITAAKIAANAIGASELATDAIGAAQIATNAITAAKIAADAIGASELAADAVTEIQVGLAKEAALNITDGKVDDIKATTDQFVFTIANEVDANAVSGGGAGATPAAVADAVWDELQSEHVTAGTFGEMATETAAIQAKTDQLTFTVANQVDANALTGGGGATAGEVADAVWDEAQADHVAVGSFGEMATETAAIQAQTDQLAFTVANQVDANALTGGGGATAGEVADAVWDEAQADHVAVGSFGEMATEVATIAVDVENVDGVFPASVGQLAAVDVKIDTIAADVVNVDGIVPASAGDLATVDGEVGTILSLLNDATAEPGQGAPPAVLNAIDRLRYVYKAWRNESEQSATEYRLKNAAGTVVDHKAPASELASVATKGTVVSGP